MTRDSAGNELKRGDTVTLRAGVVAAVAGMCTVIVEPATRITLRADRVLKLFGPDNWPLTEEKKMAADKVGCYADEALASSLAGMTWQDMAATVALAAKKKVGFAASPAEYYNHEHVDACLGAAVAMTECARCCLARCSTDV